MATTVYTGRPTSCGREAVTLENAAVALAMRDEIDCRLVDGRDRGSSTPPGLIRVKPNTRVIALGQAAHVLLADIEKHSLLVGNPSLSSSSAQSAAQVERLIWSCVNTAKIVALGKAAGIFAQLLPTHDRRLYEVPPLRLTPAGETTGAAIMIIDHNAEDAEALDLANSLATCGVRVTYAARPSSAASRVRTWTEHSQIHVHVGHHTMSEDALRLVDSWQSRSVALQLLPRRGMSDRTASSHPLLIENEANGFLCHSPEAIRACCDELLADAALRKKLVEAGAQAAAPLARTWTVIADELLSCPPEPGP